MNHIRALAGVLAVSAASLSFVGMPGQSLAAGEPILDQFGSTWAALTNIRSGPGFEYPIQYQVGAGTSLNIVCYTNDAGGNLWYQLADGNYVLGSAVSGSVGVSECIAYGSPRP